MIKLADPVAMLRQGAPRIIRNDQELKEYTEALFRLTAKNKPTRAEIDAIDLLTLLITTYEAQHRTLPKASSVDVLRFLMEQHHLSQRDLVPEIGSESLVSRILSGERNLTVEHMHALAARFHVPPGVFLGSKQQRAA
jgi:HTH-type transcriptional regulator / antitoxin HigA